MARSIQAERRARLRARLSQALRARGATPNGLSWTALGFAVLAALMFALAWREPPRDAAGLLLLAALALQGRLLCNRLDGLMARQAQMIGRAGEVYNEAPDRLSDVLICLGVGYGLQHVLSWGAELGWAAALLCVGTAYVRMLGLACGVSEPVQGPMARVQRMHWLSLAALLAAAALLLQRSAIAEIFLVLTLALLIGGAALTIVIRLRAIVRELEWK
ncbi:CDP-alcohol phosphatidyltransferase family protein [Xanthomonas sp. NCPPB 2654]|uniref:CDP-alcohol phosphatidyltransferase family protein n=1 Tax=unclassified Xanthomonas TaxID=2643310 RepID=UPI0021DFC292|nr:MULTISPECIES: CDP-alcohol phosphatidyltransferase family protein [unclassified Xanthomonas]MDL5367572.1 CDP-alcohol phosphatidyltransferase family protein [Xanthomonas sp. NCPPB 2654]UYC21244.1 CDP-alcohol phosphatidyltransferase family protein [Xanthomonas sp. CFBP 8443]